MHRTNTTCLNVKIYFKFDISDPEFPPKMWISFPIFWEEREIPSKNYDPSANTAR